MKKRAGIILFIVVTGWFLRPVSLVFLQLPYSTIVNDHEGRLLSARIADDHQWRFPIIKEVPFKFEQSLLAYEDKRFYDHPGVDPVSLARAIRQNVMAGKIVSGASTLTMQLARLAADHHDRTFWNKIKEINFALRLETWQKKKDILKWYSSLAPFGGNVVGLEAACWRYYKKSPDQLSWSEAATMAVLPNAPSMIHVNRNRAQLLQKRNILLDKLLQNGILDTIGHEAALEEPLPSKIYSLPNYASHYLDFIKNHQQGSVKSGTIHSALQKGVGDVMDRLYTEWRDNEIFNAGVLILNTRTGDVLAYHGNIPSTSEEKSVDMIQAQRSSGSILKPFLYAHMINEGMISPKGLVLDIPTYISGFNPSNYNKSFSGALHADEALKRSLNVPAVRMLQDYGVDKLLYRLRDQGITTLSNGPDHYGLSLILGGGEVTLWDLAHAYQRMGSVLLENGKNETLSKAAIFQTFEALKDVSRPDEEGNWQRIQSRFPIAWKTGTSYGHRDAWAVGVTPEYTIATWVGNADGEGRDGIIGTAAAGRLLFAITGILDQEGYWFDPPYAEMGYLNICKESGHLAGPNCKNILAYYLPLQSENSPSCPYHTQHYVNANGTYRVDPSCTLTEEASLRTYFELPPAVTQYYHRAHPEFHSLPPVDPSCYNAASNLDMEFIYPLHNDIVFLPKDLNSEQQGVVIKLAHRQNNAKVYWYLGKEYLGKTEYFHELTLIRQEGVQTITAVDHLGNSVVRTFQISNRIHP